MSGGPDGRWPDHPLDRCDRPTPPGEPARDEVPGARAELPGRDAYGGTARWAPAREADVPSSDEAALRGMLHDAVREVRPRDGALDHLRRAVPARRARKRQALVGAAAVVMLVGTAVPALTHATGSGPSPAGREVADHAAEAEDGSGAGENPAGGSGGSVDGDGPTAGEEKRAPAADEREEPTGEPGGPTDGGEPSAEAPTAPACTADRLGPVGGSTAAPDSAGVVHGVFRVANASSEACVVTGPGTVRATAEGAADPARVDTTRHTAGDTVVGLPDPRLEQPGLTLAPGAAYEVRFAWVPSESCPTRTGPGGTVDERGEGGEGDAVEDGEPAPESPTEEGTAGVEGADVAGGTAYAEDFGLAPQLTAEDAPGGGGVVVGWTPDTAPGDARDAGAAVEEATARIADACAGTVYWTGVLGAS
ncbi:hypothetical protein [Streptomyces sp. HSG2]|uniref:hypothetical protein n=1 Tax=Streptomyces sp. HSG2 TaxID=2797167 RepID=UPI001F5BDF21|nr:hypothetical protein [Streptomyces sp. HSG2]